MEWLTAHPYRAAIIAGAILLIGGGFLVIDRIPVDPSGDTGKWATGTVPLDPIGYGGLPPAQKDQREAIVREQLRDAAPYSYAPELPFNPLSSESGGDVLSLQELATLLGGDTEQSQQQKERGDGLAEAYALIPQGLLSITTPSTDMSDMQRRVYDYGNRVGAEIQSFEDLYPNVIPMLRDAAEDRHNNEKQARVKDYAEGLQALAGALISITDVPSNTQKLHKALAKSYYDAGKGLAVMADARTDEEVLSAMDAYHAEMDIFVENYIALATHFVALDVTFKEYDTGSVFSFTPLSSGNLY